MCKLVGESLDYDKAGNKFHGGNDIIIMYKQIICHTASDVFK